MSRRRALYWIISVALTIALIEGLCLLTLSVVAPALDAHASWVALGSNRFQLSPYFGYTQKPDRRVQSLLPERFLDALSDGDPAPWVDLKTNNYGFFSPHDYPYSKAATNQYVIGIFGGSVAQWFAIQGQRELSERLKRSPVLADRDIVVLNFAMGSYKQPQQLLVAAYFDSIGQHLDAIVNIDGLNEAVVPLLNVNRGVEPAMPVAGVMAEILAGAGLSESNADIIRAGQLAKARQNLPRIATDFDACATSICRTWHWALYERTFAEAHKLAGQRPTEVNTANIINLPAWAGTSVDLEELINTWANASRHLASLASENAAVYVHALQPNQYYSNHRFSAEERAIAINSEHLFKAPVEQAYPAYAAHMERLAAEGVNAYDLTALFDDIDDRIYADDCCHYNTRGNELLAQSIAAALLREIVRQ